MGHNCIFFLSYNWEYMTHLLLYRSYKTNQSGFKLENKLNNNGATYVIIIYNIIYI